MAGYPADVLRILGIHPDFDSPSMNDLIEACEQEYNEIRARLCTILDELADFEPSEHRIPLDVLLPLDALALSATNQILQSVDLAYQGARFYEAWRVLIDFCKSHFESLYLPLLKERFKTAAEGYEKRSGQTVLWEILRLFVQRFRTDYSISLRTDSRADASRLGRGSYPPNILRNLTDNMPVIRPSLLKMSIFQASFLRIGSLRLICHTLRMWMRGGRNCQNRWAAVEQPDPWVGNPTPDTPDT